MAPLRLTVTGQCRASLARAWPLDFFLPLAAQQYLPVSHPFNGRAILAPPALFSRTTGTPHGFVLGDVKRGVGAALCVLPVYHAGKVVRAAHASTTGGPRTRHGRPLPWRARRRENGQTADNPARSRNASAARSHETMSNFEASANIPHLPSGDESQSLTTRSAFRDCPRNHHIRRKAFCDRARQLLPDLGAKVESTATGLYGPEPEEQPRLKSLADLLERRAKLCDWFAQGKPAEVVVPFGSIPDGEITPRFVRC